MGKVIVIANQKGGVGKTTTTVNLASNLAHLNNRVIVIDIDPQANATSGIGLEIKDIRNSIYECLIDQCEPKDAVYKTKVDNLYILPAHINLAGAQIELLEIPQKEFALKKVISKIKDDYDYVLIDTPPSLGILTINGLVASNSVLIPLQCEYYAMEGLSQLLNTVKLIQTKLNQELLIEGILLTMYDSRTNLSAQVVEEVSNYFKDKVFKTIIPRNVKLSEAPSFGVPINLYDPASNGAKSYMEFTKEMVNHNEG